MAALIKFSLNARWVPGVEASRSKGPEKNAVLTEEAEKRSPYRGFDFGFKGIRFDPADVRTEFWLTTSHKALPDVLPVVGCWGCSAEFRDVVEAFEPDLHQFFPITIRRPNGKPILRLDGREVGPGQYFIMNPLRQIEALLPDQCISPWGQRRQNLREVMPDIDDLCVSRAAIEGRHLWLNTPFLGGGRIFVSDTLTAAIREAKLEGLELRKVRDA